MPHRIPGEVHLNLTSHPPRFGLLAPTLRSLLLQDTAPDRVTLWLHAPDLALLPEPVRVLERDEGLRIRTVSRDLRSYKKLVPALEQEPEAWHVTADDDIYYRPDWLGTLLDASRGTPASLLCWRAHLVTDTREGVLRPYRKWRPKTEMRGPDPRLFPTSGAGVLFPPGSLDRRVVDRDLAMALAPTADDLWWYWMARLSGTEVRRVGDNPRLITWEGAREDSLWRTNKREEVGNDAQIEALLEHFGNPLTMPPRPGPRSSPPARP